MKPEYKIIIPALILTVLIITAGCTENPKKTKPEGENSGMEDNSILLFVTIPPQKEMAEAVGGDYVTVKTLVPPGADPHSYEPSPGTLQEMSVADACAIVGSGLETEKNWLDKITGLNPDLKIINCSSGVKFIRSDEDADNKEGYTDPHIWLSVSNGKIMTENIKEGLIEIKPELRAEFESQTQDYLSRLDTLNSEIADKLKERRGEYILVYHPAWRYFAEEYGLNTIAIEKDGKEPTPAGIKSVIDQAEEYNINTVLISPQFNRKSAEVIAEETGSRVMTVDPLKEDYIENLRNTAEVFSEA
ncbi:metal ABC transporter solute-binding protein, Zn/Mn family [Methanoplanus endosymbiosus]|uniref:Zinc ABC transporter substrate-binding protein n=1 Tax=Methanoplanus endosymbiosus TaxID=33865 RepID=A0A9E7PN73_9EURY|nr:zinc ABC transporter substrate-binding protein [Methanoplanus endosymbiosus]UUX93395.1 zinc ABC transporter substrate-binding protein [Methanoplanus endosymbiosus]